MVIRPNGYGIWERMKRALDGMFKASGHENAYFPLSFPELHEQEAEHVEGFAPDSPWSRTGAEGARGATGRPPHERDDHLLDVCQVGQSYRDLPIKINQWANVVAGNAHPTVPANDGISLAEGHTAHATHDESRKRKRD